MKTAMSLAGLALYMCLGAGCAPVVEPEPADAPDTTAEDVAAIRALVAALDAAWTAGDADAAMRLYADEAVELPPQEPARVGKASIAERTADFASKFNDELSSTVDDVQLSGDLAFARVSYRESWTPVDGGETTSVVGKSVFVLRRQEDGSWKVLQLIWNVDAPLASR